MYMEMIFTILLLLLLLLFQPNALIGAAEEKAAKALFPAVIIFGDSIMDSGNNNGLNTLIKANFAPYGKDFPGQFPTGRFSNGRVPSDLLTSSLGVKELLPAYLDTELSPEDLLTGVCFASGGSGFDPLTPSLVSVISMPEQLRMFGDYKKKLLTAAAEKGGGGEETAASIISGAIYFVCAGTDDLANTYFGTPFRREEYDIASYVAMLVSYASEFVQGLCALGADKVAYIGMPPVGCVPSQRTVAGGISRGCDEERNEAALLFNTEMNKEIQRLKDKDITISNGGRGTLSGKRVFFVDIYPILLDLILHPHQNGFEESTKGCCGTGDYEVSILCNGVTTSTAGLCVNDTKYVFWDSYHPTQTAYTIIVEQLLDKYIKYFI